MSLKKCIQTVETRFSMFVLYGAHLTLQNLIEVEIL